MLLINKLALNYFFGLLNLSKNLFQERLKYNIGNRHHLIIKISNFITDHFLNTIIYFILLIMVCFFLFKNDLLVSFLSLFFLLFLFMVLQIAISRNAGFLLIKQKFSQNMFNLMIYGLQNIYQNTLFFPKKVFYKKLLLFQKLLYQKINKEALINNFINALINLIFYLIFFIVLYSGFWQIMQNKLTIGWFFAITSLLLFLIIPIRELINFKFSFSSFATQISQYNEIKRNYHLDEEEESIVFEKIQLLDISFNYNNCEKLILENLSAEITSGITVIYGKSGSGKSTLGKILAQILSPSQGKLIMINNDGKSYDWEHCNAISYLDSKNIFLNDTILNNLRFLNSKITDEKIFLLCKKLFIYDEIMKRPQKFYTIINGTANNLSHSQKYLLILIRFLLTAPQVLIIEELFEIFDQKKAESILQVCKELVPFIFVITNKAKIIEGCQEISL